VTRGHSSSTPKKHKHRLAEIGLARPEDSYYCLYELRNEQTEQCREKNRVAEKALKIRYIQIHRCQSFTCREDRVKSCFIDLAQGGVYYTLMDDALKNILGPDDEGRRLDRILRIAYKTVPLSAIHRSLRKGYIRVNGMKKSHDYRCHSGDLIEGTLLPSHTAASDSIRDTTSPSPLPILPQTLLLLETEDLLFIDKPIGALVHDGETSLEAMVRGYLTGKIRESLAFSPGPLHRLDRNTSGIITFSRSISGARDFSEALKNGTVEKTYIALLSGNMHEGALWRDLMARNQNSRKSYVNNLPTGENSADGIGEAITEVTPIIANESATLAAIRLQTGRTHQIRAQAAGHGHPLIGDMKYGGRKSSQPYFLHAWKLVFKKKLFKDLPDNIEAFLPDYFQETIESIFAMEANDVYSVLRQFRP